MNLNDRYLQWELEQVVRESEERRLTSETVDILHGHPEFSLFPVMPSGDQTAAET
jgi:hypothetical protein